MDPDDQVGQQEGDVQDGSQNTGCAQCGVDYDLQMGEDWTELFLKGDWNVHFCSTVCILAFFAGPQATQVLWCSWEEARGMTSEGGYFCAGCRDRDETKTVVVMNGWYGSPADMGAAFCSVECVKTYFTGFASWYQLSTPVGKQPNHPAEHGACPTCDRSMEP